MSLAARDLYEPRWSETILAEWTRNVRANLPHVLPERLERTVTLMRATVPQGMVTGFEARMGALELPDPDDRHVLAAALHTQAQAIVTHNLRDFPATVLGPLGVEAITPDVLVGRLLDMHPDPVLAALRKQRSRLNKPPMSPEEFLSTLERNGLPGLVRWVREQGEPI